MGCSLACSEAPSHSTVQSIEEWKSTATSLLLRVFSQESEESWFKEVAQCLHNWEGCDYDFRSASRFEEYELLNPALAELKYRQTDRHPLWALLEADLADNRNPIGYLLQTFSVRLARYSLEAAHDVMRDPEGASFLLASLTASILKMVYVLRECVLSYYTSIAHLLKARHEDVESLVLNCAVQGELYLLMQRLAQVLVSKRAEVLKKNIIQQEGELVEDSVAKVRSLLQKFILTESITEKRELLEEVECVVLRSAPEGSKQLLVASFLALGLQSINSDLLITKLLTSNAPGFLYVLMDCVDAATSD